MIKERFVWRSSSSCTFIISAYLGHEYLLLSFHHNDHIAPSLPPTCDYDSDGSRFRTPNRHMQGRQRGAASLLIDHFIAQNIIDFAVT